jgi:hypothetical protein
MNYCLAGATTAPQMFNEHIIKHQSVSENNCA